MTHVACESKIRSVVRSSMHPCLITKVAIRRAFVYYAQAVHALSAGIKCRHCKSLSTANVCIWLWSSEKVANDDMDSELV